MSDKSVTVRQNIIRNCTLYVGSDVMRGLRALSMRSIDPLLDCADAVGDRLLREALKSIPELAERQKVIESFFKSLPDIELDRLEAALSPETKQNAASANVDAAIDPL